MSMNVGISGKGRKKVAVSMNTCFWCGKSKEIIIGKKLVSESTEVPMHVCLNTEPCDECAKKFAMGIHVIGVVEGHQYKGRLPLADSEKGLYATGSCFVCKEDCGLINDMPEDIRKEVLEKRKCFMPEKFVLQINKGYNEFMGRDRDSKYESYIT